MQWTVVYICEAHASDVWPLKFSFEQPKPTSIFQRAEYARKCSVELGFDAAGFGVLCDGMDGCFNTAFGAWPTAYMLVDQSGELLHVGEAAADEYAYDVKEFIEEVRRAVSAHEGRRFQDAKR